jgi:hypothetical protein
VTAHVRLRPHTTALPFTFTHSLLCVPQKAAALDPLNAAASPGPEGEAALQRREEACYQHPVAVLRLLIDRTGEFCGWRGVSGVCGGAAGLPAEGVWRV